MYRICLTGMALVVVAPTALAQSIAKHPRRLRTRAAKSFREMAKLTAAIRARDAGRAEASMREHIASLKADILASASELDLAGGV